MKESQESEEIQKIAKRLTRRQFLSKVAIGAALLGLLGIIPRSHQLQEQDKEFLLKEEIERQFNVKIYTLKEIFENSGENYRPEDFPNVPTKWDTERLLLLKRSLASLPAHLYQPSPEGVKVWITLGESGYCCGFASTRKQPYQVQVGVSQFSPDNSTEAFGTLVHELVHLATPLTRREEELPGGHVYPDSPWFKKINSIFGEEFSKINFELWEKVEEKNKILDEKVGPKRPVPRGILTPDEEERADFYFHLAYGLSPERPIPDEFISVLAEHYVYGKDYFFRRYSEFFPEEKVRNLFNFVKNEIFKGKEYGSLPITP